MPSELPVVEANEPEVGAEVDVSKHRDGGVLKVLKRKGDGVDRPGRGDTVYVHYVGTLDDGSQFDSSRGRNETFNFVLGKGDVIKAWDQAVATMKKNELCTIKCQPSYAYGETGSPPKIPANAVLNFEIELLSWDGEDVSPDKDKSMLRTRVVDSDDTNFEYPDDGSTVTAHVSGMYEGRQFVDDNFTFVVGEGTEHGLPEGVDRVIKKFKKGEKSRITINKRYGYGSLGKPEFNIPPNAFPLVFEIELVDLIKVKESWKMDDDEKLSESEKLKSRGTDFFKQAKYKLAIGKYKRVVDLVENMKSLEGEKKEKRDSLFHAACLNVALCFSKKDEWVESMKYCDKVLDEDENNVKARYRRAQAQFSRRNYDEAMADYDLILALEPANKAAMQGIQQCKHEINAHKTKEKKAFRNMFDKMAEKDIKTELANLKNQAKNNTAVDQNGSGEKVEDKEVESA